MASILVITQRVPFPPNKGEKLRTYYQIKFLRDLGHSITVLSPVDGQPDRQNASDLATKLNLRVITKPLGNKLFRFAKGLLRGRSLSEANFFSNALQIDIANFAEDADVILCSASSLARYVFNLSNRNNALLLMDYMDVDSDKWLQYAKNSSWPMNLIYKREHRLIAKLEREVIQHFDVGFIIAQAEFDLFQSKVLLTNKLQILGNGIDQTEFHSSACKTEHTHFLFSGVMDYKPNIEAVLWFVDKCWDAIKIEVPNAKFTIAGMNPSPKIRNLEKDSSIEVTGFVDDIMPFFHRANIFVAPFQIARGVQNKVLQAMSCAIPVVTTPLGAEGIVSEDGKNMYVARSETEFIQACLTLATQIDVRDEVGKNAQKTISDNYSWNGVLQPLKEVIEQRIDKK